MNTAKVPHPDNPLERLAGSIPAGAATLVAALAVLAAVALALFVALNETYDETQVFAAGVAIIGLSTVAPVRGKVGGTWMVFGDAMLLYAGAFLFHVSVGPALLVAGGIATAAALVANHHHERGAWLAVAGLFAAMGAITALVIVVVFVVGG